MNIAEQFESHPITDLDLSHYAEVQSGTSVCTTIEAMNDRRSTCAFVTDDERLVGVFTDRDVLVKVVAEPGTWDRPVDELMTSDPVTLQVDASPAAGLELMNEFYLRNIPVLTEEGTVAGNLTHFCLMRLADRLLRDERSLGGHDPAAQHGILFVDFTGLTLHKPVTVTAETSLAHAVRQMRVRGIGSVMVVDERGSLLGVLTERDLQAKVACRVRDLEATPVTTWMTAEPISLSPRDPIADGFTTMAEHGFSHIPLVSETSRPVGVVSFRDLADYLATSFAAYG